MGYPTTEIRLENNGKLLTIGAAGSLVAEAGATLTGFSGITTFASQAEITAGAEAAKCIAPDQLALALAVDPLVTAKTITTAALGTVRQVFGSISASHAAISGGTIAGVRGLATLSGVISAGGAYLYGTQGKLIVTGTMNHADSRLAACMAQIDAVTGGPGTLTAGQLSGLWIDSQTPAGAGGGQFNPIRITLNAGSKPNAIMFVQSDASFLFDLSTPSGGAQSFVVAAGVNAASAGNAAGVAAKVIKIELNDGDTYYLPLFAANT
jgi:hypothetical protein